MILPVGGLMYLTRRPPTLLVMHWCTGKHRYVAIIRWRSNRRRR